MSHNTAYDDTLAPILHTNGLSQPVALCHFTPVNAANATTLCSTLFVDDVTTYVHCCLHEIVTGKEPLCPNLTLSNLPAHTMCTYGIVDVTMASTNLKITKLRFSTANKVSSFLALAYTGRTVLSNATVA